MLLLCLFRVPPVALACSSSLVCSSCVSPVSSSRAWVSGKKVAEGGPTQSPESSEESFPRALKSFQNRSKMAPRRLENRSKMAPGGLPGASREPKLIFDCFLASVESLSWAAPEASWAAPGGHFGLLAVTFSSFLGGLFGGLARGLQKSSCFNVFLCFCVLFWFSF